MANELDYRNHQLIRLTLGKHIKLLNILIDID